MSLEHDSEPNKVTPLSQARLGRKSSNMNDLTEDKPITEGRLKEVLSELVSNPLVAKLTRIEKSINRMVSQFEAIRSGKAQDAALRGVWQLSDTVGETFLNTLRVLKLRRRLVEID